MPVASAKDVPVSRGFFRGGSRRERLPVSASCSASLSRTISLIESVSLFVGSIESERSTAAIASGNCPVLASRAAAMLQPSALLGSICTTCFTVSSDSWNWPIAPRICAFKINPSTNVGFICRIVSTNW